MNLMFVGISGVGKTSFLRTASRGLKFQHLTAGTLIAAGAEQDRDGLRLSNISDNQRYLIDGFKLMRDPNAEVAVLDGHSIIDTGNALKQIEAEVFRELEIDGMIHLEAAPEIILRNRSADFSRERPLLSTETLSAHQRQSMNCAISVAHLLDIPFLAVCHNDHDDFEKFVLEIKARQH